MKTMSISEFAKMFNFVEVAKVTRKNSNGYGYVTFINASNVATNVYFSKSLDAEVSEGTTITRSFLADKIIAETSNEAGETRYKIAHKDSQRLELSDLL